MQSGYGLDDVFEVSNVETRSITAENPEGEVGAGGQAASDLGPSRKGRPFVPLESGETMTLADVDGPGVVRHIWLTGIGPEAATDEGDAAWRDVTLRMYWDGEDDPSVEVPLADFFCNGMGVRSTVNSMPIVVAPASGFNSYWPLPFREHAKITLESDHPAEIPSIYHQIDYTLGDDLSEDTAYFHAQFRRENPTTKGEDFTILDGVEGNGHYVGTYLGWTALSDGWWGEGEVKFYVDGDDEFPTICGTGTEDYPGGSYGFLGADEDGEHVPQTYSTPFLGYHQYDPTGGVQEGPQKHGLYRWHVPDPIHFQEDLRVTVQQIGAKHHQLYERSDDVSSVAYWYQKEPHAPFPEYPDREGRRPR